MNDSTSHATRNFQPLSQRHGPRDEYDVIVIGAGIGGLVASNLLAMRGLKVLLVEQHYMVGGYCSTFRRRGYTFDAASHFYPLLGNPTTLTGKLLAEIGVDTEWIKMDPVDQFHLPDGTRFEVPADFDTYLATLKRDFPDEADSLDRFFRVTRKLYLWGALHFFRDVETARLHPYQDLTVRDAIDRYFRSPRLKLLLTADCPHWGSPPCRTSFVFDSMLRLSYFEGNYYPRGGSQTFADALARRFQDHGGDVLLKSRVRRIVVRDGRVQAIELETGPLRSRRTIATKTRAVVSNADMRLTVEQLLAPATLPPEYTDGIRQLRPTFPCFLSHLGVQGISQETLREVHGYYWRGWDADQVAAGAFDFKIFVPTLYEPDMAPAGCHVVILQKVLDINYEAIDDWQSHKLAIEMFLLRELERIVPGFRDQIQVCMSATAHTAHRFTLNYHGAMLGWEMSPDQLGKHRPDVVSPVGGLYFAGQWTRPGGGITPTIVSAMRSAKAVEEQFGAGSQDNNANQPLDADAASSDFARFHDDDHDVHANRKLESS